MDVGIIIIVLVIGWFVYDQFLFRRKKKEKKNDDQPAVEKKTCPSCKFYLSSESFYCPNCSLAYDYCDDCGAAIPDGSNFCPICSVIQHDKGFSLSTGSNYNLSEVKTIPGEKTKDYIRKFKTKVVGVTFENSDGSSRQTAIKNLKKGQRLQLAWDPNNPHDKNAILVFGEGSMSYVNTSSCIGHLKADLAADVVDWIQGDDLKGIYAEVVSIHGGAKNQSTLGCVIELRVY